MDDTDFSREYKEAVGIIHITNKTPHSEDEICGTFYKCPKCETDYIISGFSFCPRCGAKIIWEVEDKIEENKYTMPEAILQG